MALARLYGYLEIDLRIIPTNIRRSECAREMKEVRMASRPGNSIKVGSD